MTSGRMSRSSRGSVENHTTSFVLYRCWVPVPGDSQWKAPPPHLGLPDMTQEGLGPEHITGLCGTPLLTPPVLLESVCFLVLWFSKQWQEQK